MTQLALGPLMIDIAGTVLTDLDRQRLSHPLVGGIILFTRNYANPEQLVQLTADIHELRTPALLIAVDHEGGRVQRFREGFTHLPSMATLGKLWDDHPESALNAASQVGYFFMQAWKRSEKMQKIMDRLMLRIPVFGDLVNKSSVARWTRTLSTMFAAGVPLVEALDSVGGASGNMVYAQATEQIQRDVSTGAALTTSMTATGVFPTMVLQMASIGEESGSLDHMLAKAAEFYEDEVDEMVKGLSSLMEPFIIVILGVLIGGIVVSMYLPIFKLGAVV